MAAGTDRVSASDGPFDAQAMLRAEFAHVLDDPSWTDPHSAPLADRFKQMHALPAAQRPSALCLSGGGVRSATFCLGVLQWLAEMQQLQTFHYLSTVSGGGYIGSWLVNGLCQAGPSLVQRADEAADKLIGAAQKDLDDARNASAATRAAAAARVTEAGLEAEAVRRVAAAAAPFAASHLLKRVGQSSGSIDGSGAAGAARTDGSARDPVAPLRAFSNYLSPTGGLSGDAFSLAAIFIRNLLLNALVWLSLLAAIVAAPRLYIAALGFVPAAEDGLWILRTVVGLAWLAIVAGVAFIVADLPAPRAVPPVATAPNAAARQAAAASTSRRDRFFWACFVPVVLAAIVLSIGGAWITRLRELPWWAFALAGASAHWLGVPVGIVLRTARGLPKRRSNLNAVVGVAVVGLVGFFGGALAFVALEQLAADAGTVAATGQQRLLYASFAVPAMTGAFWLAMSLYAGLMGRFTDEHDREWWARATGKWLKFSLLWLAAFALVVWLPLPILDLLGATGPTAVQFGVGGGVLGVVTSLIGYWGKNGVDLKRKAQGFLKATRLKLLDLMAALVVLSTLLALSMGWSAALDRCHGWDWTDGLCTTDLHAQTEFLREQTRLHAEYDSAAQRDPAAAASAAAVLTRLDEGSARPGRSASAQVYRHVLLGADGWMILVTGLLLLAFAAGLALAMGVNVFSLHGMYGNRLVRAYLGSGRAQRRAHWFTGFDPDDNPKLHLLHTPLRDDNDKPRLFPVINIALNIVRPSPKHLDWQQRKAAPFIATPLHCGAAVVGVGFRPSARYADGMSLGRALTISGAAASPNMGYHSSALVTFVMTLFNVRLGWWSPNPGRTSDQRWTKEHPWIGVDVALAEASGNTGVDGRFVYLSDGGHFDNLGIYEMVRRRCQRIVAVDATCDGKFKWTDLLDVVRKIRVDLGIPIELPAALPGHKGDTARLRCIEAPIRYSARDGNDRAQDGKLIVLKPRLLPEQDPPELAAYADASAADGSAADDPARFPHQSTADQFFNEQQFESYRLLGYTTAAKTLGDKAAVAAAAPRRLRRPAAAAALAAPVAAGSAGAAAQTPQTTVGSSADIAGAGGVGYLIHQMGSGAALATALTIGGTLGVAGTVALAPTELRLSDPDRALLRQGMALKLDAGALQLNPDDRRLLSAGIRVSADGSALYDPAKHLSDAAERLFAAAERIGGLPPPQPPGSAASITVALDRPLQLALTDLKTEVTRLSQRIGGSPSGAAPPADDASLIGAMNQLRDKIDAVERKLTKGSDLDTALGELKTAVENIAPRRNVRGQDGGPR